MSAIARPAARSSSRLSMSAAPSISASMGASKPSGTAGGSRASDEDSRTAVRVGTSRAAFYRYNH